MAHIKEKFLRSAAISQSSATQVRDAERMSKITESQNKAATDLLQTTAYVIMKSVDLSDKDAKTTPYLAVTCDEYADLIKRNAPLAHADKSAYTQAASLMRDGPRWSQVQGVTECQQTNTFGRWSERCVSVAHLFSLFSPTPLEKSHR